MADILSLETPYQDQDTVTSTNLNDLVKKATFTSAVVDGATTQLSSGAIIVRDGGITEQKLSTAAQAKLLQGPELEQPDALIGGDKTGNARGSDSLDIQSKRSQNSEVTSGDESVAVGLECTSSGGNSTALGFTAKATAENATALGDLVTASGAASLAVGSDNLASGASSVAIGDGCSAAGDSSIAAGKASSAPGDTSIAIGFENEVEDTCTDSAAIGYANVVTANAQKSLAVGADNEAGGEKAIAVGANNLVTVTGSGYSSAVGSNNTVSNTESHAFGRNIQISSAYSVEMGIWASGTARATAVKATYNGGVALTCENSASAPSDQATAGAEDIQELGRDMFTIQRNGDAFTLYFNDGGTIKSLSLGTVS